MAVRPENSQERLDSWKEIAAYLKRDVRTVQRWEKLEKLPVHRHLHNSLPSVYAYPSEIDAWWNNRRPKLAPEPSETGASRLRRVSAWALGGLVAAVAIAVFVVLPPSDSNGRPVPGDLPLLRRVPGPDAGAIQVGLPSGTLLPYGDLETGDLFLFDMASGERRRLTHEASWASGGDYVFASSLSPDERWIAYSWYSQQADSMDLRLLDVATGGTEPSVLYSDPEVVSIRLAEWSRDGSRFLALFSRTGGSSQLVVVDVAPRALRVVKTFEAAAPAGLSLSPDGSHIVYDAFGDENERDVFRLSILERSERGLVDDPGNDTFPLWTPDGRSILFTSDRTETLSLWKLDLLEGEPEGEPESLHKDLGRAAPLALTEDGAYYFHLQTGMVNVFVATLDPATGRVDSEPSPVAQEFIGSNLQPAWSHDGRQLAYVSRRGHLEGAPGSFALIVRDVTGDEERAPIRVRVLTPDLSFFVSPRFAPDGRSLIVKGRDHDDRWGLYRIDAEKGEVMGFLFGGSVFEAVWAPDGRAVVYNRQRRVLRYDIETGEHEELYRVEAPTAVLRFALSRDGERIAVATSDSLRLLRLGAAGAGETTTLHRLADDEGLLSVGWAPDGDHVFFTKGSHGPGERKLWRIAAEGGEGEAEDVGLSMTGLFDVSVHPDGSRVVFSAGFPSTELWVMEQFLPDPPTAELARSRTSH